MMGLRQLIGLGMLLGTAQSAYVINKNYDYTNFFDDGSFNFYNGYDSFQKQFTNYVGKQQALATGLAAVTASKQVYLGVDHNTTLNANTATGRNSLRLTSVEPMSVGLLVTDFAHMPGSICGTSYTYMLLRDGAGTYAEIDVFEADAADYTPSVNLWLEDDMCSVVDGGGQIPVSAGQVNIPYGGGVHARGPPGSFGNAFNQNQGGGGYWATEITPDGVKIWQFARNSAPADIGAPSPDPSKWPTPALYWKASQCNVTNIFRDMNIVMDVVFADNGSSAFEECDTVTGQPNARTWVANNPAYFTNSYWLINSIKYWQNPSATSPSSTPSVAPTSAQPSATAPAAKKVSTDGTCGGANGFTCNGSPYGNCCSSYGWCGQTTGHCTTGCNPLFGQCGSGAVGGSPSSTAAQPSATPPAAKKVSTDGTCGGANGFTCNGSPYGNCCSSYGWCGQTTGHCTTGCNPLFGQCGQSAVGGSPSMVTSVRTPTPTPTPSAAVKVSPDGSCGGANKYSCANSGFGNCCSSYGWCGKTDGYCTTGCQAGFGKCGSGQG